MKPCWTLITAAVLAPLLFSTTQIASAESSDSNETNKIRTFIVPMNGRIGSTITTAQTLAIETPFVTPKSAVDLLESKDGPIIIDNDAMPEIQLDDTAQWQEIPDAQGRTHISTGACFPVSILTELSSKDAKDGDPIQARTAVDIKIGGKLIAPKGTMVTGHVTNVEKARALLHSELSMKRWLRANGAIGMQFDELVTASGEHLPLVATPARSARIVKNKNEGRVLGVNDRGEIATPLSMQLKAQGAHLLIRGAASAGGVFSFGIVPVAYGTIGAICPSFAYGHPVGQSVRHRRLKGFGLGVLTGLPGGFLVADSIVHGQDAVIKPGDQFLVEFKQDFTGEASTGAELIPGATKKVHGEVVKPEKDKK
jgi:hypothetical protein